MVVAGPSSRRQLEEEAEEISSAILRSFDIGMKAFWLVLAIGCWTGTALAQHDPNCDGKTVIVHLFEWKWTDIAAECERYRFSFHICKFIYLHL